ncbi:MAG: hypothetical protein F4Y00_06980 [Bacteroidetes bacterium SB0662_bin_6]|nr:hypothetical protein [Bacteroidetes bacterium SB0668_bin_1]MYE04696.1 hypothetical protein [Bacteroidetes bacterium SB0662_bin_6]
MIDTLATAHALVEAGLEQRPAEAIARAIRNGQGYAASEDFVRAEIGAVRSEIGAVRSEIGSLRSEIGVEIGSVRAEIGSLRSEIGVEIGSVWAEMGKLHADLTEQNNALLRWIMGLGFGAIAGVLAQLVVQILQQ